MVLELNLKERHLKALMFIKIQNDIELNPGPLTQKVKKLEIFTLNCRGLGKIDKFRLVLSKISEKMRANPDSIFMLQETMIKNDNYLKLAWRGVYAFTPGTGNSQGCITLASSGVTIINQINMEHRGHYLELKGLLSNSEPENIIAILNIYAPNGYALAKRAFYETVVGQIADSQCEDVILAGDFNLTFSEADRLRRNTSSGEIGIANYFTAKINELGLKDAWNGYEGMTWKKGGAMSRLDRIYTRLAGLRQINIDTDWTLCDSDHAVVCATFETRTEKQLGGKIIRLDPQVVLEKDCLAELRQYLTEQLATIQPDMDPHSQLEFAKMTIRTKAFQISKRLKNAEILNLQLLNDDIKQHERLLAQAGSVEEEEQIILHLERQTNERNRLLEIQGRNLAWKAKTKWYNEGEKSNKYFLNLLKRNVNRMGPNCLPINNYIVRQIVI